MGDFHDGAMQVANAHHEAQMDTRYGRVDEDIEAQIDRLNGDGAAAELARAVANGEIRVEGAPTGPRGPELEMLEDRVLVKPDEAEQRSVGGIIIPEIAQEKPQRGTVLAVGPGRFIVDPMLGARNFPSALQVGDRVLYARYAGVEVDGHLILREGDIIAKER